MRRMIKRVQARRIMVMFLAIAMILSMVPLGVFAKSSGVLSLDIGGKEFVVGTATEFTLSTIANDDAGTHVKGAIVFSDFSAVEKLEYRESPEDSWSEIHSAFGPDDGFLMADAVGYFRVTFKKAGIYTVLAYLKTAEDSSILCTAGATLTVNGHSTLSTDMGEKMFVVGEATAFNLVAMANEDAGKLVLGSVVCSDPGALEKLEYKGSQEDSWSEINGEFGTAGGFVLNDYKIGYFRATFNKIGTYTVTVSLEEVETGNTLCFVNATVTVKDRSAISFETGSIEIKYSDVNATNGSLVDHVSDAVYTYTSDDEAVVKVNEYGILTPMGIGEAIITVTRKENAEYLAASATYTVKVVAGVQGELLWDKTVPESVRWNDPDGYSNTVSGGSGTGDVYYVSDKPEIAEVDPETGVLTLKKPGIVTITATKVGGTLYDDQSASYSLVIVKSEQSDLSFGESNPNAIYVGDSYSNAAIGGSVSGKVVYKSSDETVATVDENGVVTALRVPAGNDFAVVEITAALAGNDYYEDAVPVVYTLTIYRAPQKTPLVFEKGVGGQRVTCGQEYTNAVSGGDTLPVTYESSDETIATVDADGKVTALKVGTVTITASVPASEEYQAQTLSYKLVIDPMDQTVIFENSNTEILAITYGDSYQNKASATTAITYVSSDPSIADVDENGALLVKKAGTVTITAIAEATELYAEVSASYTITIYKAKQNISFEKGNKVEVTFNDDENKVSNIASSDAIANDQEDNTDITVTYSVAGGKELVVGGKCDPDTGAFEIKGAGTIIITVSFSENDRYNSSLAFYTVIVGKDDQRIAFKNSEYKMINGDNSFVAPIATEQGTLFGTASIVYSIEENEDGVVKAIDAKTGALTFTNKSGKVTIRATKPADANFKEAIATYTLTVESTELEESDLPTVVGEKIDPDSEWYTGSVSIVAADGYLLSYTEEAALSEWKQTLENVVTEDGTHEINIFAMNVESGRIYECRPITIKRDTTVPTAELKHEELNGWEKFLSIITFNLVAPDATDFTVESGDAASGVAKIEYLVVENTTDVMQKDALDAVTEWKEYTDSISVEKNRLFVVYTKVTDHAGQYVYASTNGVIFDGTPIPEENIVFDIVTDDSNGFYDEDVKLNVQIEDAMPSSGIKTVYYQVFNNDTLTQGHGVDIDNGILYQFAHENPSLGDLVVSWKNDKSIIVNAEENNSDNVRVVVTVIDNAGNVTEKEISLKICVSKPTLEVTFIDDPVAVQTYEGVTYYDANRVAQIVIAGRASVFQASEKPIFVITETMGDTAKDGTYEVVDWSTSEVEGDPDAATHTYLIKFGGSANYEFTVGYTDIFGNNLGYDSEKFAVDHDMPTASVIIDEDNTWSALLETLTFGLWSNQAVTVKATPEDATSPIQSIEYFKSNSDLILNTTALETVEWNAFEEFTVDRDEQFTIYLKVTDRAGHVNYICSDGFIVDMTEGDIAITPDNPNENGVYGGDFEVRIDIEDIEPYSGIKTVEYWVTCDGVETVRKTLYSYEYVRDEGPDSNSGTLKIYRDGVLESELTGVAPTKENLTAAFSHTVTVDAAANNSDNVKVHVRAVDNAGNEWTKETDYLKVDVTAPEISVIFDVNNVNMVGDRGYLKTNRMATIVFTERTSSFDREKATAGIVFGGVDSTGKEISLDRSVMIKWGDTVETEGNPDAATHTAYVYFTTDANYDFTVSYTDQAGHACEYADVVFADGSEAPRYFTVDKENPSATISVAENTWDKLIEVLTFGILKNEQVSVSAEAEDATSPVTIEYLKTNLVEPLKKEDLDAITEWKSYSDFDITADERFVVYLKVTDHAGNYIYLSTNGHVIDMTTSDITLTPEQHERYHGLIPLYHNDVNVLIDVKEKTDDAYSGIKEVVYWVECDGKETQREVLYTFDKADPAYADLLASFSKTVTILSELNNSCDVVLYVTVTDNAGNVETKFTKVDIDITAPTITVDLDNDTAYKVVDGKGYFPKARKATVVITERADHFDAAKATESIKISAVDATGKVVIEDCSTLVSEWGSGEDETHTATVNFSADANYEFTLSYEDLAANNCAYEEVVFADDTVAPRYFAVDQTAPTGTVTAGELGTWDKLIGILTFGLWSKDTVDITGTVEDITTPIESVSYYKTFDTIAKTVDDLRAITDWTEFNGLTVPADEQFVVYIRIVDFAGNVTYISTNGIIVDDTIPSIEAVKPEITITPTPANGIYNSDVTVAVSVLDPKIGISNAYAGLREIRYEVYSLGAKTQEGTLFSFEFVEENGEKVLRIYDKDGLVSERKNYTPTYGDLINAWEDKAAIVVNKNLNNSNDVKIVVYAVDNAGNDNKAECDIKIDITAPTIEVTYDNNDGDTSFDESVFFKADRTAKIVVTERNFDPARVRLTITNTDGYVPEISGWTTVKASGNGDLTTHTAYVVFDQDGDYTFDISCTDTAINANTAVNYANALAPTAFTVDKTAPIVSIVYDNNEVQNGNYYKAQRIATLTVSEHNFETGRIKIALKATDDGVEATLPTVSDWTSNGDVHTATITYAADSLYVFDFDYSDKAGNATADIAEQTFYVDTINPVLKIEKIVDESANNDEGDIGFVMIATDTNFDVFTPILTAVTKKGDTFETKQLELGQITDIKNGKVFTVTNIDADGIYRITCTLIDKAGNAYSEVTLEKADGSTYVEQRAGADTLVTFSVNRDGSTYEVDENTLAIVEQYYVQNIENDVVIVEINVDPLKEYAVTLNGKELEKDKDYTVTEEGSNGAWMKYTYKVNKSLFAEEGEYKLVVSSKDKADNDAFSDVKEAAVEFVVDRTAPVVTVSGIANDGRYQTDKQLVTLIPTDDGGALKTLIVNMVDEDGEVIKEVINLTGEALMTELEANGGKITFEIAEGLYQNVQIICTDYATGETEATNTHDTTITNVSVSSSVFMIFWANKSLRWGTIGGVSAVVIALAVFIILKKKKRKDA